MININKTFLPILFLMVFLGKNPLAQSQSLALSSAEQSFNFINTTLQTFQNTGRLTNNPGIDGADLEAYIAVLEDFYEQFSRRFNRDSAMCKFYMNPENGRMTIEERAELAFSFLPDLEQRIEAYTAVDADFQDEIAYEFGTLLLENINRIKPGISSNQRLPASNFDEAAVISFLDSSCT